MQSVYRSTTLLSWHSLVFLATCAAASITQISKANETCNTLNAVSWWKGEGNATDSVDGNNGTTSGSLSFSPGLVGRAFNFDGVDDHITIPAAANLNASSFTMETWIFPAEMDRFMPLFEFGIPTGYGGVHFWMNHPGTVGGLFVNIRETSGLDHPFSTPSGIIDSDKWNHVAVTFDQASGICRIFANGAIVATQTFENITPRTSIPLYLGYRSSGSFDSMGGSRYHGLMDEAAFYARALTPNEILSIYNAGANGKCGNPPPPPPPPPPVQETLRIVWQHANGRLAIWQFSNTNFIRPAPISISFKAASTEVVASYDVDNDNDLDFLVRDSSHRLSLWYVQDNQVFSGTNFARDRFIPRNANIVGFGDLNSDSKADLVWQDANSVHVWFLNGKIVTSEQIIPSLNAELIAIHDYNTDGNPDFLWLNPDRTLQVSYMQGTSLLYSQYINGNQPVAKGWQLAGLADFNGDGKDDFLWEHVSGRVAVWFMNGPSRIGTLPLRAGKPADPGWRVVGVEQR